MGRLSTQYVKLMSSGSGRASREPLWCNLAQAQSGIEAKPPFIPNPIDGLLYAALAFSQF
jgi:hypothetical protein